MIPPRPGMPSESPSTPPRQLAPTYWAIILIKFSKGMFFGLLALGVFSLAGDDLPAELQRVLRWANLDPEREVFSHLAQWLGTITPANIRWVASGTLLYGLLGFGESIGLAFRNPWVGWLVICESALLIPYEVYHLAHGITTILSLVLMINVVIVWYLFQNRHRLFRHHHHHHAQQSQAVTMPPTNARPDRAT